MIDLANHNDGNYVPLKDISERQQISLKYLGIIMIDLAQNGLVDSKHGKAGGYRLNRPLCDYTVGAILRATEGDLAPIACLECNAEPCPRAQYCTTIAMWHQLNDIINDFFDGKTLQDFVPSQPK